MIAKSTESRERVKGQSPLQGCRDSVPAGGKGKVPCASSLYVQPHAHFRPRRGCTTRNRESAQSGRGIPRRTGRRRTARLPHPLADGSPAQAASLYDDRSANPAGLARLRRPCRIFSAFTRSRCRFSPLSACSAQNVTGPRVTATCRISSRTRLFARFRRTGIGKSSTIVSPSCQSPERYA